MDVISNKRHYPEQVKAGKYLLSLRLYSAKTMELKASLQLTGSVMMQIIKMKEEQRGICGQLVV